MFKRRISAPGLIYPVALYAIVLGPLLLHKSYSLIISAEEDGEGECQPNDFQFHYTQCDENGERWRFAVPKSRRRHCRNTPDPMPGLNCTFSCPAGNYLDIESQQCRQCPAGSYSLGDGVRYERFTKMPSGFSVENFPDQTDQLIFQQSADSLQGCSKQVGWVIQNGELRYLPTPCVSKLSISLSFAYDGYIQFYYKMPRNSRSLMSILLVRNAYCQSYSDQSIPHSISSYYSSDSDFGTLDNEVSALLSPPQHSSTGDSAGELQRRRLRVRSGQNLITWTVSNKHELTTLADIIYISKIDIFGLSYTPICSPCPPGTFSRAGSAKCYICQSGTFSHEGASNCEQCASDEYSGPKAEKCIRRPTCTDFDYYKSRAARCFSNATLQSTHVERVQPAVCKESTPSPSLIETTNEKCGSCRPGMERDPKTGVCKYCSVDEFSADGSACRKCANDSIPEYGLFFSRWDYFPDEVTMTCEYIFAEEGQQCEFRPTWIPSGDRIVSARMRSRGVALGLNFNVDVGFYNPLRMGGMSAKPTLQNPFAEVSIDFTISCADQTCQLYFVQERINSSLLNRYRVLASFNGTQPRSRYSYPILENRPTRFLFAFMRSGVDTENDVISDQVTLYSLNITHVGDSKRRIGGGGRNCTRCSSRDPTSQQCQSCPVGHYSDEKNRCVKCPPGTALNISSSLSGIDKCVKCGPNLGSEDGSECGFTGRFEIIDTSDGDTNTTMKFDITPLKDRVFVAEGIRVFAREGTSYFHSFNVSIFGTPVVCRDTYDAATLLDKGASAEQNASFEASDAVFCRSAAIPSSISAHSAEKIVANDTRDTNASSTEKSKRSQNGDILYVSSTVISRQISAITTDRNFVDFHLSNEQLEYDSSLSSVARPVDIHIFYEPTRTRLSNCPHGTIGVTTLRCESTAVDEPLIRLSRKCPDGTCDGCLYHVIIESSFACPICHPNDFEEIRGECIDNYQKIHYIPSKHCIMSGAQNHKRTEICSNISKNVTLLFLFSVLLITCLIIAVVVFYQKNKSLEYHYMRIVEGKEDLMAVNSCALNDEEDDENEEDAPTASSNKGDKSNNTRVFFGKRRNNYAVSIHKDLKKTKNPCEMEDFLSGESSEES